MPRKSSIHFKPVENVRFAVSHSERTDLSAPSYLLPKEHQLDNIVVAGSLSEDELAALFIQQKERMSRQAKTAKASPFFEGVAVLKNTDGIEQSANLLQWKKAYEQATGHAVLHMSIHLDEGFIDETGEPKYTPHAHVIVSRMDEKNRVIHLGRKQLSQVQDLTAETLQMGRGETLEERGGRRGRKHIPHAEFRKLSDENRLELDKEKENSAYFYQKGNAELAQLKARYDAERDVLKASGKALQSDYQNLKKEYESLREKALLIQAQRDKLKAKLAESEKQNKALRDALANAQEPQSIVLTIDTSTAAFEDTGRGQEAARIVSDAAQLIAEGWSGKAVNLKDLNGNNVGKLSAAEGNFSKLDAGEIVLVMPADAEAVGTLQAVAAQLQEQQNRPVKRVRHVARDDNDLTP